MRNWPSAHSLRNQPAVAALGCQHCRLRGRSRSWCWRCAATPAQAQLGLSAPSAPYYNSFPLLLRRRLCRRAAARFKDDLQRRHQVADRGPLDRFDLLLHDVRRVLLPDGAESPSARQLHRRAEALHLLLRLDAARAVSGRHHPAGVGARGRRALGHQQAADAHRAVRAHLQHAARADQQQRGRAARGRGAGADAGADRRFGDRADHDAGHAPPPRVDGPGLQVRPADQRSGQGALAVARRRPTTGRRPGSTCNWARPTLRPATCRRPPQILERSLVVHGRARPSAHRPRRLSSWA